jgi:hypothetical protein
MDIGVLVRHLEFARKALNQRFRRPMSKQEVEALRSDLKIVLVTLTRLSDEAKEALAQELKVKRS